jgi:hypothetical protein
VKKRRRTSWFSSDFRLIHQAEIRGISRTLRRSQPTPGKSVGKPRPLPEGWYALRNLPRGYR